MRFADSHSIFLGHEPPILQLTSFQPQIRGWKAQILLNRAAGSPIFSIWDGTRWENHQITLQIAMPTADAPILLCGVLTTNTRGLFVFYVSHSLGVPTPNFAAWLKENYTYDAYINPFVIRPMGSCPTPI